MYSVVVIISEIDDGSETHVCEETFIVETNRIDEFVADFWGYDAERDGDGYEAINHDVKWRVASSTVINPDELPVLQKYLRQL